MKGRIQGVSAQMKGFRFFFGVSLGLLNFATLTILVVQCKEQTCHQLKVKK